MLKKPLLRKRRNKEPSFRTQVAVEEEPVNMYDDVKLVIEDCLRDTVKDGLAW